MYRDLNDYELLYMVEDEKDSIFNILLEKYKPLIFKMVSPYVSLFKKFGYEIEDLMQVGYITLYKSSFLYHEYNEAMFYTYFKKSLNNAIFALVRFNSTNKKETLNRALSYDLELPNSDVRYIDLLSEKNISADYTKELIIFKNSMPCELSWVFELLYNGYNKNEISILLARTTSDVKRIFTKIKTHALTYKSLFFE